MFQQDEQKNHECKCSEVISNKVATNAWNLEACKGIKETPLWNLKKIQECYTVTINDWKTGNNRKYTCDANALKLRTGPAI